MLGIWLHITVTPFKDIYLTENKLFTWESYASAQIAWLALNITSAMPAWNNICIVFLHLSEVARGPNLQIPTYILNTYKGW